MFAIVFMILMFGLLGICLTLLLPVDSVKTDGTNEATDAQFKTFTIYYV